MGTPLRVLIVENSDDDASLLVRELRSGGYDPIFERVDTAAAPIFDCGANVTCKSPLSPWMNCRIVLAFVSMTHSITSLPAEFLTAIDIVSLCTSSPIYFVLSMEGAPSVGIDANTQNLRQKGRPLYCVIANTERVKPLTS